MSASRLDLSKLSEAVREAAAFRAKAMLQPAGGKGDKVFPPTYAVDRDATTKYAFEKRRVDGQEVPCVLIDSVQSQANRLEQALVAAWRQGQIDIPVVQVDFSEQEELEDVGAITSLEAPHRVADALLRDSLLGDTPFRHSEPGRDFTLARTTSATSLYRYCPTALLFGIWDSTGPMGGLGAKFARAMVSEIVGIDAEPGVKTQSRIDPVGIERKAGPVYETADGDWTLSEDEAVKDKKKPKTKGDGNPSEINHGNIAPSIDAVSGGVTMEYALQTTVLSLPSLRRLRFPTGTDGKPIDDANRADAEHAARTAVAALGLCAIVLQRQEGYDLRSRCFLLPDKPAELELVSMEGQVLDRFSPSVEGAVALLREASEAAGKQGLGWEAEPIHLTPTPKLAALLRRSRQLVARGDVEEA